MPLPCEDKHSAHIYDEILQGYYTCKQERKLTQKRKTLAMQLEKNACKHGGTLGMCTVPSLQVATEARLRKGQVVTFLKGGLRPEDSGLQARDQVSYLFRSMIEEVERNHSTQVRI